jgi:hypothetical protein
LAPICSSKAKLAVRSLRWLAKTLKSALCGSRLNWFNFAQSDDGILLISHGSLLHQMLPLVLANVDGIFVEQHPLRNCVYVCTHVKDGILACVDWDGWAEDFPIDS